MEESINGRARVYLQPIAAPLILGLYAFAGSTLIVAAELARWYGNSQTALFLFPFAAAFGGVAQFATGMWSYKARDAIATAMHEAFIFDSVRLPEILNSKTSTNGGVRPR